MNERPLYHQQHYNYPLSSSISKTVLNDTNVYMYRGSYAPNYACVLANRYIESQEVRRLKKKKKNEEFLLCISNDDETKLN
ncbi:hypothetical protein DERF_000996 [Dermatophagoides farinae]|uniref:Uncharacterized protein n=1 Tax=Dermatophagoides farinae TaxID=6954 RepID=A0A922IB06_DERFA|nr:hypothetical protein DERF_000996 [Dermatophagoides farinae]